MDSIDAAPRRANDKSINGEGSNFQKILVEECQAVSTLPVEF